MPVLPEEFIQLLHISIKPDSTKKDRIVFAFFGFVNLMIVSG